MQRNSADGIECASKGLIGREREVRGATTSPRLPAGARVAEALAEAHKRSGEIMDRTAQLFSQLLGTSPSLPDRESNPHSGFLGAAEEQLTDLNHRLAMITELLGQMQAELGQ